jgi:hypothetical protein
MQQCFGLAGELGFALPSEVFAAVGLADRSVAASRFVLLGYVLHREAGQGRRRARPARTVSPVAGWSWEDYRVAKDR